MDFNPMTIAPRTRSVQTLKNYPWIWYVVGTAVMISIGITVFVLIQKKKERTV